MVNADTNLASCLDDDAIYFLVALKGKENVQFSLAKIPRTAEERFIVLPTQGTKKEKFIVLVDDVFKYFTIITFHACKLDI